MKIYRSHCSYAQELQKGYGILPSIIIGQAILESDWGQSSLASKYNNLFGIKSFGHSKVTLDTQEFYNGEWSRFKEIVSMILGKNQWSSLMLFVNGVDWNPALYVDVLTANDYRSAAQALQDAGQRIRLCQQNHSSHWNLPIESIWSIRKELAAYGRKKYAKITTDLRKDIVKVPKVIREASGIQILGNKSAPLFLLRILRSSVIQMRTLW